MLALLLTGCVYTIWFPPELWAWDSGDTGNDGRGASSASTATGTTSTGDDGDPTAPGLVSALAWGCDADDTAWAWTVRVDQWTSGATLDLFAGQATEEHDMVLVAADPSGTWDERRAGPLADGADPAAQVANASTRFDCEADAAALSFAIRVRGADGTLIDCVVGGADPADATARVRALDPDLASLGTCRSWGP